MNNQIRRVAVIDGCRTPFQRSGTGFADLMGWDIGRFAVKGILAKAGIDSAMVDHVIMGCVAPDIATTNIAREVALGAGIPERVPAHTCTVACISANMATTNGANMIATGNADVVVAGGVETLSDADIRLSKKYRRFILDLTTFRKPKTWTDTLKLLKGMRPADFLYPERPSISEFSTGQTMGENAERLRKRLGITRQEQDEYAAMSHRRAAEAREKGIIDKEITPVVIPGTQTVITADNGPRKDATPEKLAGLKPAFDKAYGTVTAGNSSFLTDGAAAVLLMSEEKANELGLKPKAFIKAYAYSAQDPMEELLLGPAFAIAMVLDKAGLKLSEIGVFEIHEAFAAQMLANLRLLESPQFAREKFGKSKAIGRIKLEKLNIHGGSLSLGHPFGATGGRLITTCCNRLIEENQAFGIVAGCAAGGIGSAIVIENANHGGRS